MHVGINFHNPLIAIVTHPIGGSRYAFPLSLQLRWGYVALEGKQTKPFHLDYNYHLPLIATDNFINF